MFPKKQSIAAVKPQSNSKSLKKNIFYGKQVFQPKKYQFSEDILDSGSDSSSVLSDSSKQIIDSFDISKFNNKKLKNM